MMKGRAGAGIAVAVTAAAALGSTPGAVRASGAEAERAYRAGKAAPSEEEGRQHYQRGVATARAALARDPDDPGALLWYAANLAAEALTHGKLYTLRVIPEIERTLLRVEQRSPLFDNAAAARALGRLYHKAPAFISIGSDRKAGELLQRALARAPAFPGNQAFAAELYLDQRDCGRARPLAQKILATPDLGRYGARGAEDAGHAVVSQPIGYPSLADSLNRRGRFAGLADGQRVVRGAMKSRISSQRT